MSRQPGAPHAMRSIISATSLVLIALLLGPATARAVTVSIVPADTTVTPLGVEKLPK